MEKSYDEFKKIVKKEFTKDEIEGFDKTNNGYGVYVIAYGEKEIEIMCDDLRQCGFECKWWHSSDPEDDEPIYFIEAIPIMNESKNSIRKPIKESYLDEVTNLYFFDLDVDEECEVQLENFVMPCRISQFYKNDRYMYLIVQSKTSDKTYFVITYNYKKNKFVSSKVFSSYREAKNQLVDTIAMVF